MPSPDPGQNVAALCHFALNASAHATLAAGLVTLARRSEWTIEPASLACILKNRDDSPTGHRILTLRFADQGAHHLPERLARAKALAKWAAEADHVMVVSDRSFWTSSAQLMLGFLLVILWLKGSNRIRFSHIRHGPRRVWKYLTKQHWPRPDPEQSRRDAFDFICQRIPERARLTAEAIEKQAIEAGDADLLDRIRTLATVAQNVDLGRVFDGLMDRAPPNTALKDAIHSGRFAAHLACANVPRAARNLISIAFGDHAHPPMEPALHARARLFEDWLMGRAFPSPWLAEPICASDHSLTNQEMLMVMCLAPLAPGPEAFQRPWKDQRLKKWCCLHKSDAGPQLAICSQAAPGTGLDQNARMAVAAMRQAGLEPVHSGTKPEARPTPTALAASVTLHMTNADQIPQSMLSSLIHGPGYQIGHLLWEFDQLPESHKLALDLLDEIWVPSTFVAETYRKATGKPVIWMGKAIAMPDIPHKADANRFQALVAFDAGSSVARKNPLAAVRAFQAAFPRDPTASLVIKSTPLAHGHWGDPEDQLGQIRQLAAHDTRIRLIERHMPLSALLRLISSCNCLISAHRAEGFGYFPAFAMALGCPVVTTDHGGVQDFCTTDTAWPVPARLIPAPKDQTLYPLNGAVWAEIDEEALSNTLRVIASNPIETRQKTRPGMRLMATQYSQHALAARYRARLFKLGLLAIPENGLDQMFA